MPRSVFRWILCYTECKYTVRFVFPAGLRCAPASSHWSLDLSPPVQHSSGVVVIVGLWDSVCSGNLITPIEHLMNWIRSDSDDPGQSCSGHRLARASPSDRNRTHKGRMCCLLPSHQNTQPHAWRGHLKSCLLFQRCSCCRQRSTDKGVAYVFLRRRNHGKAEQQADSGGDGGSGEEHRV